MKLKYLLIMLWAVNLNSCQQDTNVYDCEDGRKELTCSDQTAEEKAMASMKAGEFVTASAIYKELIVAEPEKYKLYALRGAALAGESGFRILDLVNVTFGGDGSLIELLGDFLPSPADYETPALYGKAVDTMKLSVNQLLAIPANLRSETSEETYSPSAIFQLTVYQSAYSLMLMNKFALNVEGEFDPEQLKTMTESDAVEILQSLRDAATVGGEDSEALAGAIDKALVDIDSQEGGTSSEKLKKFLELEQAG